MFVKVYNVQQAVQTVVAPCRTCFVSVKYCKIVDHLDHPAIAKEFAMAEEDCATQLVATAEFH